MKKRCKTKIAKIHLVKWLIVLAIMPCTSLLAQGIPDSPYSLSEKVKSIIFKTDSSIANIISNSDIIVGYDGSGRFRSQLEFDISNIPSNAVVNFITLNFNSYPLSSNDEYSFDVNVVNSTNAFVLDTIYTRIENGTTIGSIDYNRRTSLNIYPDNGDLLTKVFSGDTSLSNTAGRLELGFMSKNEDQNDSYLTIQNITVSVNFSVQVKLTNISEETGESITGSGLSIEGEFVSSGGTSNPLPGGFEVMIQTNNELLDEGKILKHNRWNGNSEDYQMNRIDTLNTIAKLSQDAIFKPINAVSVETRLLDTQSLNTLPVEVKDPWYVAGNGEQNAPWISYSSGFKSSTMPNGGVFLNQEFIPGNPNIPYYSIRGSLAYTDANNIVYNFTKWDWDFNEASISSPNAINGNYRESPVVFKQLNAKIEAVYKGFNVSNKTNTMGEDQRRMMAEDFENDNIYRLYESGGRIWYQWRDRNTNSWSFERQVAVPPHNDSPVTKPSIAVSAGKLWVVYQYDQEGYTWLAITLISNPTSSNPNMQSKYIDSFMKPSPGTSAIPEIATAGYQLYTTPFENNSRAVLFAVVLSDMGLRSPAVYSLFEEGTNIGSAYTPIDFLKQGRSYVNTDGGISVAANTGLIGFTWSDNNKVYFNQAYFHGDGYSIGYSLLATDVVSDYNPQYENSKQPTLSAAGEGFSLAFKTVWNTVAVGPLKVIVETDVTSRPLDLTLHLLPGWGIIPSPEFYYPILGATVFSGTGPKEYAIARHNGKMKLYEKLSTGWQLGRSLNVSDRTISHFTSEQGAIASYSSPVSGLPISELKEYETYSGGNFKATPTALKMNNPVVGVLWKEGKEEELKEFWIGGVTTNQKEIPLETNSKTRYELKLTEPFFLSSNKIDISYTFGEDESEVPFEIALFDTSGNKVADLKKSWEKGQKSVNPTLKYAEAMTSFQKASFHVSGFISEPVLLKVVSKDSTAFTWMQVGLENDLDETNNQGSLEKELAEIPDTFELYHNYPNPFNPSTNIIFDLPEKASVKLQVFDISGRLVTTIVDGTLSVGKHEKLFLARSLSSGVYFARITAVGEQGTHFIKHIKMSLIK